MIAVDTNILIYAHRSESPFHESALDALDRLAARSCPTFRCIAEGASHWQYLEGLLREGRVQGPLVHDARIASVCLAHGVEELWSVDRDFSRFPQLRVVNPFTREIR